MNRRHDKATKKPTYSSRTLTITTSHSRHVDSPETNVNTSALESSSSAVIGSLHLQAADEPEEERRRVRWSQETIDNEHLNKKKSNICCIFHPQNENEYEKIDGSDSETSFPSDEEEIDKIVQNGHQCHSENHPNAYERQPKWIKKSK